MSSLTNDGYFVFITIGVFLAILSVSLTRRIKWLTKTLDTAAAICLVVGVILIAHTSFGFP